MKWRQAIRMLLSSDSRPKVTFPFALMWLPGRFAVRDGVGRYSERGGFHSAMWESSRWSYPQCCAPGSHWTRLWICLLVWLKMTRFDKCYPMCTLKSVAGRLCPPHWKLNPVRFPDSTSIWLGQEKQEVPWKRRWPGSPSLWSVPGNCERP